MQVTQKEIHDGHQVGQKSRVFRTWQRVQMHLTQALHPSDTLVYVFVTHNVVSKMFFCAKRGKARGIISDMRQ